MATSDKKFLRQVSGKITEIAATQVGGSTTYADQIPALDAQGKLDSSMMPAGLSVVTVSATASESIAAGDFVNLYLNAGVLTVRKADNSGSTGWKQAHGFALAGIANAASGTIYMLGSGNNQRTGLTIGAPYYLSTAGGVTATVPTTATTNIQYLGIAINTTTIATVVSPPIELSA